MPVFPSKSTAISDLVLACSCIWSLYSIYGGMPSIGLKPRDGGMAANNLASVWFALTLAASLLGAFRFPETNKVTGYLALASMFSMTGCAVYSRNYYQLLACLLMFSSSRAFDITEKRRLGLPPVDWLHYGLAASNFLLVAGLCHTDLPGIDKLRHWTGNAMSSMFS
ncbi:hypothetical protein GHT06_018077 [Daphnia sinensis]|uniref:Uncharacterized protein n=1 Tax=Daphnia sinensis TaxID=1820382 RepID=A0AAD5KN79_9CRUS|nr:hypothetical protein GHT06_018077 [Daphnia sinensis]